MEKLDTKTSQSAAVIRKTDTAEVMQAKGVYHVECFGPDGKIKWVEDAPNTVTNQGKNSMLDTYFAPSATPTYYMTLITAGAATSLSTYATPIVTETTSSVIANRLLVGWSGASTGSKAATTTAFSIIGSATITGAMMVTAATSVTTVADTAGTSGKMFSAATFSGGSKIVGSGDTLNVSWSVQL